MAELTEAEIKAILRAVGQLTWHGRLIPYMDGWYDKVAGSGTQTHDFEKVDPKRIRVITHVGAYNDVSSNTFTYIFHYNGILYLPMAGQVAPAIGEVVAFDGMEILKPGDLVRVSFETCVSGDDLYVGINGYEIILED